MTPPCPHCGQRFSVRTTLLLATRSFILKCDKCSAVVQVPFGLHILGGIFGAVLGLIIILIGQAVIGATESKILRAITLIGLIPIFLTLALDPFVAVIAQWTNGNTGPRAHRCD